MTDDDDAPSRLLDKFVLRMPDGMRDNLKKAAETNSRSMNAEIIARLRHFDILWKEVDTLRSRLRFEAVPGDDIAKRLESVEQSGDVAAKDRMLAVLERERLALEGASLKEAQEAITSGLNDLREQRQYLENLKAEMLSMSSRKAPMTTEPFDRLFTDVVNRLDRIEKKVDKSDE